MVGFEELYSGVYLIKVPFSGFWTGAILITGDERE